MVRTQEPYYEPEAVFSVEAADSSEMDTDFKVLEWQQIANESAIKQELMQQPQLTRQGVIGTQPGDVRAQVKIATNRPIKGKLTSQEKASWMERILEEEQHKPLKVSQQFVRKFQEREDELKERRMFDKKRFTQKIGKMEATRKEINAQHAMSAAVKQERNKFQAREAARVTGQIFDEGDYDQNNPRNSPDGEEEEGEFDAEVQDITAVSAKDALANWPAGGPSWNSEKATNSKTVFRDRAPQIEFVKRHTPATGSTPSQIIYAVRVAPALDDATAPVSQKHQADAGPPALGKRTRKLRSLVEESDTELRLRGARIEREEKRRHQEERARYQDAVIGQWMLEKRDIERQRKAHANRVRKRERNRMIEDRARIMAMEDQMRPATATPLITPPRSPLAMRTQSEARPHTAEPPVSTSAYLQRQRQLLLEDYLRKHMSAPLQAGSAVLAGLEEMHPARPSSRQQNRAASADPINNRSEYRGEGAS